ncbi:MAG: beta-ketoacyl synthase N-terminal-like domain-containing protein [Planctomycetota bacterium]|nr:beta-ketoacyl synthase N-terminal-like domain-containing protein [Planctomycetota bacterium]
MRRRVVITGLGAVTPLGMGMPALWEGLVGGRSALGPMTRTDPSGFASRLGGEIPNFSAKDHVPKHYRKAVKVMARDTEIAVAAAKAAVEDAGLVTRGTGDGTGAPTYPPERFGCQIGSGLISAETLELTMALATAVGDGPADHAGFDMRAWGGHEGSGGMNNLPPLWMLKYLPNMLACHVTIIHGAEGPSNTLTCAEASGLLCIGEGTRVIERHAADGCYCGGAEAKLMLMGLCRLTFAERLAPTGEETDGSRVVRPFDPGSAGSLLGEGGAIVVLESLETATARGARVYAEVAGFGAAHSGPPLFAPLPAPTQDACNEGLAFAIEAALADAGIGPGEIDAIVPQGLGAPAVDARELGALRAVFGARLAEIPLVTLTPAIGDLFAGHGAVQAAVGAMCVREQRLPARLHAGTPAPDARCGADAARAAEVRHLLVTTASMGGQNAALVLRRAR